MTELTPKLRKKYIKAAAELKRRGWAKHTLAQTRIMSFDKNDNIPRETKVSVKDCKVCALGALGAAFYGTPNKGGHSDGNGYDTLLEHLADIIDPGWRSDWTPEYLAHPENRAHLTSRVIYRFNDSHADSVDDVIAMFEKAAAS